MEHQTTEQLERQLLGGAILDNSLMKYLEVEYFQGENIQIAAAMCVLWNRGVEIDLVSLTQRLKEANLLDALGGPANIAGLIDGIPRPTEEGFFDQITRLRGREED